MTQTTAVHAQQRGQVTVLTLHGPERRNALASSTLQMLDAAIEAAERSNACRALIITGHAPAFCAGADIVEFSKLNSPSAFAAHLREATDVYDRLAQSPLPSIAALEGYALGGGLELALACDLRVAGRTCRLGVPEVNLGLLPGQAGTQRLARMLPSGRARQLIMTGDPLDAQTALEWGLLNTVVDDGQALESASELADRLAGRAPLAIAAAKQLIDQAGPLPFAAGVALERATVAALFGTDDVAEGIAAFREKRAPSFKGA